jgi:hypothetical protein
VLPPNRSRNGTRAGRTGAWGGARADRVQLRSALPKLVLCDDPPTSSEVVKATVHGIRRTMGSAPVRKTSATADKVVAMAALADSDMKGLRDRAIFLLFGFAGAFRRSELVALDVTDLEFCDGGMRVHIRRSKTDQEGAGDTIERRSIAEDKNAEVPRRPAPANHGACATRARSRPSSRSAPATARCG